MEVIEDREKEYKLKQLLQKYHSSRTNRVIVFVLYKKEAVRVERMLQNAGWKVASVHGDKAQGERNTAVDTFRQGTCPLLVATDVAARGLDIPNVSAVINYSFPLTTEVCTPLLVEGATPRVPRERAENTRYAFRALTADAPCRTMCIALVARVELDRVAYHILYLPPQIRYINESLWIV